jgi:glycosyltransferase involved in cell wall biosynthesis
MNSFLTVITPTYNRADLLTRCYESLVRQKNKNFEWLIVDDGSTDNTRTMVVNFKKEKKIPIRYIYKENGGKHTALNRGVKEIQSELTLILDSDDYLMDDAVETIANYYSKYKNQNNICAFTFLKIHPNGKSLSKKLPQDEFVEGYIECRINRHIGGDMAEVFYTHCLREFPFPEFKNEKFISEDVVWIKMSLKYKMVFISKPIYYADYLEGGLTFSGRPMKIKSPLGAMERAKMLMLKQCALSCRIKGILLYVSYGKFANKKFHEMLCDCGHPFLFLLFSPFGYLLYFLWKRKYM